MCVQNFALSAVEMGSIIGAQPGVEVQLFHDPGMLSGAQGQVTKQLKIQPSPDGKVGSVRIKRKMAGRLQARVE